MAQAQTWADFLVVDFERDAFDVQGLSAFMRGIVDGGPKPDRYRMVTVLATLPSNCRSRAEMVANARRVAGSVSLPVICDADTGYGNPLSVMRTVGGQ